MLQTHTATSLNKAFELSLVLPGMMPKRWRIRKEREQLNGLVTDKYELTEIETSDPDLQAAVVSIRKVLIDAVERYVNDFH